MTGFASLLANGNSWICQYVTITANYIHSDKRQHEGYLKNWHINLSLSSQLPSGIVGSPGTLKWLAWRFCAVLLDTIHTSFLLSGLLHSLERYSVMHLATSSFQWRSSLSLICQEDKQDEHLSGCTHNSLLLCCHQQVFIIKNKKCKKRQNFFILATLEISHHSHLRT